MAIEQVDEYADGVLVNSYTVEVPQESVNERTIEQQARTALTNNKEYLAIGQPTQAEAVAQVKALTRQMNKTIRLMLRDFTDTE